MKKVAIYFLFLCFYLNAKAQRENYWQLGGGGGFNWFWLYNKNDFAGLKPDVLTDKPNSYWGGISGGYFYKHYFGVEAKIFYSLQNQYYTTQGHDPRYNYFTRTRLEYLSVPIMVTFTNSDEDAVQFIGKIGIASRVLLRYNDLYFETNKTDKEYVNVQESEGTEHHLNYVFPINNYRAEFSTHIDQIYKRYSFGGVVEMGIKKVFANNVGFSITANLQFDFTDPENKNAQEYYNGNKYLILTQTKWTAGGNGPRTATHNIFAGLYFEVFYQFR